mmetsp:Transcript_47042/g.102427  ORF Transcript_47042/g.102427 Transcript_47042/m.102427 type:complete len:342 (+) Transcript_47042:1-1026(+)
MKTSMSESGPMAHHAARHGKHHKCVVVFAALYVAHTMLGPLFPGFVLGRHAGWITQVRGRTSSRCQSENLQSTPGTEGDGTSASTREFLDRTWKLEPQVGSSGQIHARVTDSLQIQPGQVLIADPRRFAAAACRAGAGSVGLLPDLADWVLRISAFFGIGGLDLVADIDRWKRSNWMPVVLVTDVSPNHAEGVSLTARTGILLGDLEEEGALSFASRPLHWGGPERSPLLLLHPYEGVPESKELGDSGLFVSRNLRQAREWLDENTGSSLRFRFFSNRVQWAAGELERELQNGVWFPVSASRDLVLDESQSVGADPLWSVIASLVGGEVEDLGNSYDLFSR